ncbi:MAG: PhzF family phenazine biosynthesis protein [Francisellaceae bacterium]
MKLKIYQIDAFSNRLFSGNPAAVIPLDFWLNDEQLLAIAAENNLSETAYFVPTDSGFHLRWFTPGGEVKLCGHATLATAFVLFEYMDYPGECIRFDSLSGELVVKRINDRIELDFPAIPVKAVAQVNNALIDGIGVKPSAVFCSHQDYMLVYDDMQTVIGLNPDFNRLNQLDLRGVLVTAKGDDYDFVSRCFFPKYGVNEDPVTGSAHCILAPYWAKQLDKKLLSARQWSKRGGDIECEVIEDRVLLRGGAVFYMKGELILP